jgi:hypothetical protein
MPDSAPLPPLPEYTCGGCGLEFGSNCTLDDITCPDCDAKWCPGCGVWFGGDAGEPEDQGVMVGREDLELAVNALARGEWTTTGDQRAAAAFARLNDALDAAGEATAGE